MLQRAHCLCRRRSYIHVQRRTLFGLGEVLSVITQPAETIKQLNESKELLQKARDDLKLRQEAKQIPRKHTFAKLPGFHGREREQRLLKRILKGNPAFSVIFGATSVGKTALLREVLAGDGYHVLKFDLRISGFADLRSLYVTLCQQFQQFFEEIGHEDVQKNALIFKHMILELEQKESEHGYRVTVADIASMMESLQSGMLTYWEISTEPKDDETADEKSGADGTAERKNEAKEDEEPEYRDRKHKVQRNARTADSKAAQKAEAQADQDSAPAPFVKRPLVFFMDEAHKLPALIKDELALKVFLDTLLVLTKQDRLCHCIFSTSDSFFQHFLRRLNVGQHCAVYTVADPSRAAAYGYFMDELIMRYPADLRPQVNFDEIFDVFGGKLSHISDFVDAVVNADGSLSPLTSSIFIQAYALLQFHLNHGRFETFSPLTTATVEADENATPLAFTREQLLSVMRRLAVSPFSVPYFDLCQEMGTASVDGLVQARIVELRWTKAISPEMDGVERKWSRDGIERPILLPMTPVLRKAMEIILAEGDTDRLFQ